jgi:hypothetical protein
LFAALVEQVKQPAEHKSQVVVEALKKLIINGENEYYFG